MKLGNKWKKVGRIKIICMEWENEKVDKHDIAKNVVQDNYIIGLAKKVSLKEPVYFAFIFCFFVLFCFYLLFYCYFLLSFFFFFLEEVGLGASISNRLGMIYEKKKEAICGVRDQFVQLTKIRRIAGFSFPYLFSVRECKNTGKNMLNLFECNFFRP